MQAIIEILAPIRLGNTVLRRSPVIGLVIGKDKNAEDFISSYLHTWQNKVLACSSNLKLTTSKEKPST